MLTGLYPVTHGAHYDEDRGEEMFGSKVKRLGTGVVTIAEVATQHDRYELGVELPQHPDTTGTSDRIRLGTSESNAFVHEEAALSTEAFQYRVTFVDACGDEQAFCGATDCP